MRLISRGRALVYRLDSWFFGSLLNIPPLRGRIRGVHAPAIGVAAFLFRSLRFWTLVWLAILIVDATLLVSSRVGVQTILQVTPAALVAVLVFAIGAVFAIIQSLVATYGVRASLLVPLHGWVAGTALRPLVLLITALLLAGQVPDQGHPASALTAGASVIVLATAAATLAAAVALPSAFTTFLAPVNFGGIVLENVRLYFESEALGMVGFRLGLLEQMLVASLRRGDNVGSKVAVNSLMDMHRAYVGTVGAHPANRQYTYNDGSTVTGWFGSELGTALSRGGEEYLRTPGSEDVYVAIADALHIAGVDYACNGLTEEADAIISAQLRLATSIHQMGPSGVVNNWSAAAPGLAAIEQAAEQNGQLQIAIEALSAWCVATSYVATRWERVHPHWLDGVRSFGAAAPFDAAADRILSESYLQMWAIKMPLGPFLVVGNLAQAKEAFENRDDPAFVPAPFREEPAESDDPDA